MKVFEQNRQFTVQMSEGKNVDTYALNASEPHDVRMSTVDDEWIKRNASEYGIKVPVACPRRSVGARHQQRSAFQWIAIVELDSDLLTQTREGCFNSIEPVVKVWSVEPPNLRRPPLNVT